MPARAARLVRVALAGALVAAADFLFYGHRVGISLFLFLVLLAVAAVLANRLRATRGEWIAAASVLVLALIPLVEAIGLLSVSFGLAGVAAFTLLVTGNWRAPWIERARRMMVLLTADLGRIGRRYSRWRRSRRSGVLLRPVSALAGWFLPLALGSVFVTLFSFANPIFWSWISLLDLWALITALEPLRLLLWAVVGLFVWVFVRMPGFAASKRGAIGSGLETVPPGWSLGTTLIVRSLLVFNAIFALQTVLDVVYLWGGAELPAGVSPAANAQKAAYLLVVSALLAAGFVLVAIRDTGDRDSTRLIRGLIHLWIAQNVVLVLSAILRLDLYVELYSLTHLRLAAFIWMGLVVTGLILIVLRIAMSRSNGWLIRANLVSLGIALYGSSVIDLDAVIAGYNVRHSREISGHGVRLDRHYLCELGPSALPAIHAFGSMPGETPARLRAPAILDACARSFRETLTARARLESVVLSRTQIAASYGRSAGARENG